MTTSAKLAELKKLAGEAGKSIYRRLGLVRDIMADGEYVIAHYGNEAKALETLEADCFGDLCGARSLSELLAMLADFPAEEKWKQSKWNLSRLLAEWDDMRDQRRRDEQNANARKSPERVSVKEHKELVQKHQESETILQHMTTEKSKLVSDAEQLRVRVQELERENIDLKARVNELERLLEPHLSHSYRR